MTDEGFDNNKNKYQIKYIKDSHSLRVFNETKTKSFQISLKNAYLNKNITIITPFNDTEDTNDVIIENVKEKTCKLIRTDDKLCFVFKISKYKKIEMHIPKTSFTFDISSLTETSVQKYDTAVQLAYYKYLCTQMKNIMNTKLINSVSIQNFSVCLNKLTNMFPHLDYNEKIILLNKIIKNNGVIKVHSCRFLTDVKFGSYKGNFNLCNHWECYGINLSPSGNGTFGWINGAIWCHGSVSNIYSNDANQTKKGIEEFFKQKPFIKTNKNINIASDKIRKTISDNIFSKNPTSPCFCDPITIDFSIYNMEKELPTFLTDTEEKLSDELIKLRQNNNSLSKQVDSLTKAKSKEKKEFSETIGKQINNILSLEKTVKSLTNLRDKDTKKIKELSEFKEKLKIVLKLALN